MHISDWSSDVCSSDLGLTAVGGSLGILIPPSIPLIIYASLTDVSPGQVFIAGFLPGFFIAGLLAAWVFWKAPRSSSVPAFNFSKACRVTLHSVPDQIGRAHV